MDGTDAELIGEFVVESQEGLANIEQQMLAIEAAGDQVDLDLVNAVFRTMHTIKGTSGFLGLDRVGALAHGLEEILNGMRNREITPTSELVTTILKAADFMKGLIDAVESSNEADISEHLASLQQYRPGIEASAPHSTTPSPAISPSGVTPSSEVPAPLLRESLRAFTIECRENLTRMDQDLLKLDASPDSQGLLRSMFRTMHAIKSGAEMHSLRRLEKLAGAAETLLGKLRDGKRPLTEGIVAALSATVEMCHWGLDLVERSSSDVGLHLEPIVQQLAETDREISPSESEAAVVPQSNPNLSAAPQEPEVRESSSLSLPVNHSPTQDSNGTERTSHSASENTIRVDVALLDKLMTRVGELVLARNQIVQFTSRLEDASFVSTAQRLNLITTELQEGVMKTRMQPIGNVWAKFPRVVRDLASQLGKQVHIEMSGKETELDKTIVEAIKDPLTHLVRNSVDHGIESPEVRRAAGKPIEGCLLMRAYHEGGQVNIEITDDGAGLHLERIRKKAIQRGLLSADQAARLSDRDTAQLIFSPGFSTAEQVTSVSGRGVGMDVVKTNIERIGGTIDLQNRPGQGTTIKIKIPITLAIIPALVVTNGGDRYAIPQVSLLELVRLDGVELKQGIEYVHGAPVYRLRGKLLPLVYLSERLGLISKSNADAPPLGDSAVNIVVLRANDRQFGLVVDKVNDTEEIVVKPLSRQLKGLSEFAGATIMGDGTVALILDVLALAVAAGLAGESREQTMGNSLKAEGQSERTLQTLLVVDVGDTRRFALPTSLISRLEKVSRSAVEYADGREVIQYRGAIMPLVRLGNVVGTAQPCMEDRDEMQIVVYAENDLRCGLVVNRIVDIVQTEIQFSTTRNADDNLLGTTVIQQRVTDVLNLRRLAMHLSASKFIAH